MMGKRMTQKIAKSIAPPHIYVSIVATLVVLVQIFIIPFVGR